MAYKGIFKPENPEKWFISKGGLGKGRVEYRSSWELKFMRWADRHPNVLAVASEEVVIPYRSPLDGRIHHYYTDFYIKVRNVRGEIVEKLIEVKPHAQTQQPRQKKNKKKYLWECRTYIINKTKWEAAKKWADDKGMEFVIMTEYELGLKERLTDRKARLKERKCR